MALRSHGPQSKRHLRKLQPALLYPPGTLPNGQAPPFATPEADTYRVSRLARVRGILGRIDGFAEREKDPQALSWLATAAGTWSEQEFDLADRPRPGNRRPGPDRSSPGKSGVFWGSSAPVMAAPSPAAGNARQGVSNGVGGKPGASQALSSPSQPASLLATLPENSTAVGTPQATSDPPAFVVPASPAPTAAPGSSTPPAAPPAED